MNILVVDDDTLICNGTAGRIRRMAATHSIQHCQKYTFHRITLRYFAVQTSARWLVFIIFPIKRTVNLHHSSIPFAKKRSRINPAFIITLYSGTKSAAQNAGPRRVHAKACLHPLSHRPGKACAWKLPLQNAFHASPQSWSFLHQPIPS